MASVTLPDVDVGLAVLLSSAVVSIRTYIIKIFINIIFKMLEIITIVVGLFKLSV
jgi:hypothetical protein